MKNFKITRNEYNRIEKKMSNYDFNDEKLYNDIKLGKVTLIEFVVFMDFTRFDEFFGSLTISIED